MESHWMSATQSRLLILALVVLGAGAFQAGEAGAQIKPAYTKDVDARGRMPYAVWVEFSANGCVSATCSNFATFGSVLLFDAPAVPAGKRLIVEWVSASLPSNNEINSLSFQTSPVISNQLALWQFHGPFFNEIVGGTGISGMTSGAFFTYGPGESPHVRVKVGDPSNFLSNVSISGYLIDATN